MTLEASDSPPLLDSDGPTATPEGGSTGEGQKGNREARYRTERNSAREELATATARIERMNRREVERLAGEHLSVGADLFVNGNSTESYLTESGEIDADRVREDAQLLLTERPGLRRQSPAFDPTQGHGGNAPDKGKPTFADLLK